MTPPKRSLYQCAHAKVTTDGGRIHCDKGHLFPRPGPAAGPAAGPRQLNIRSLIKGKPMVLAICQNCPDYDEMGPPVPLKDRGYIGAKDWDKLIKLGLDKGGFRV